MPDRISDYSRNIVIESYDFVIFEIIIGVKLVSARYNRVSRVFAFIQSVTVSEQLNNC